MSLKDFEKRWAGGPTVAEKLREIFSKKEPVKQKLVVANYKIRAMVSRLEVFIERLWDRDRFLFERVLDALTPGETVLTMGDVMAGLAPVLGVVKELKNMLRGIMPEISLELSEVEEGLRDVVLTTGEALGLPGGDIYASPEAKRILEEARIVAEQRMKEKFPELPVLGTIQQNATAPATGSA